jgi:hypothetical protein
VKLTVQNRQAQIQVVPSASALVIKAPKEPPRDRNRNIKHSEDITFDETVNIALQMCHTALARKFSGTMKEILGTAISMAITLMRSQMTSAMVQWSAQLVKKYKRKYFNKRSSPNTKSPVSKG